MRILTSITTSSQHGILLRTTRSEEPVESRRWLRDGRDLPLNDDRDRVVVLWTGEFGRLPITEGSDGRDQSRHAYSRLLAGGGFKSGHIHGATDEFSDRSVENRVIVPDLHATILHELEIDHTRLSFPHNARPERLTDPEVTGARVVTELLA